ncbi:MAG: ATP-binding protein, partial [Snowella sp.]
ALDHTQWIDGTPLLIGGLMVFMILRFLGLGFNNTSLYLIGGMLTVAVGIIRIFIYSLPRQSGRLGR